MYKHLTDLYESDKGTFYWMVRNKCREYYKKYIAAKKTISVLQEEIQNDFLDYQMSVVNNIKKQNKRNITGHRERPPRSFCIKTGGIFLPFS